MSLLERWFRVLLRLYPRSMQARWGDDMVRTLRGLERERGAGPWSRLSLAARLTVDTATALPKIYGRRPAPAPTVAANRGRPSPGRRFSEDKAMLPTVRHDLVVAWRRLLGHPVFSIVAIATVALGIGANTAIFSVLYGVLLRPIGVADPERLVAIRMHPSGNPSDAMGMWPGPLGIWRERLETSGSIASMTSYLFETVTLGGHGDPVELGTTLMVDGDFFAVLGVDALVGRALGPSDVIPERAAASA